MVLALFLSCVAAPVSAQPPSLDRVSFDSVIAIDKFVGQGAVDLPNVVIDATVVARIANGWIVYVRPWIRHDPRAGGLEQRDLSGRAASTNATARSPCVSTPAISCRRLASG